MTDVVITETANGRFAIEGPLTFETVPKLAAMSGRWLNAGLTTVTVDLAAVNRADSAGLAMLLEWLRQARNANIGLSFSQIPAKFIQLIRISGLEHVLAITGD